MGEKFEMHNAFSREGPKKVYVQHLLKEQGKIINDLLEQKAYFYVCGDAANMAREVNTILVQIIAEHRGKSEAKAEEIVKNMRAANQYQVCPCAIVTPKQKALTSIAGRRLVIEKRSRSWVSSVVERLRWQKQQRYVFVHWQCGIQEFWAGMYAPEFFD